MPTLPPSSDWTGAAITEGQFKTAQTALRDYLAGLLGTDGVPATALSALGAPLSAVTSKSAAYTVAATDRGKLIRCTNGPWVLSLPAVATVGASYVIAVNNESSGAITVEGDLGETINGQATIVLEQNAALLLACTGSAWVTIPGASLASIAYVDAAVANKSEVVVTEGIVAHGQAIPVPQGYSRSQLKYCISDSGVAYSSSCVGKSVAVNQSTGVVTCQRSVWSVVEDSCISSSCSVNYICIGVK